MPGRIFELPVHPGPFPWTHTVPSDSEANGSFGFTHRSLAENYTGDSRVLPTVTALTGGGSALDGVVTAGGAVTTLAVREVLLGRQSLRYQLVNGSDAESVPEVIRPNDWHGSTNTRVWRLLVSANRLQLSGQPGVSCTNLTSTLTGLTLGTEEFTGWVRLLAVPGANLTQLICLKNPADNNNLIHLGLASGALTLKRADGSGALSTLATVADFATRFQDSVVDLVLVRRRTADVNTHELVVYANGEELVLVSLAAGLTVASETFRVVTVSGTSARAPLYRSVLFNRALAAGEIYRLSQHGVEVADRWGRTAVGYQADWSAGVDSWTVIGGGTLAGNIDGVGIPSTDNALRYTVPASPVSSQRLGRVLSLTPSLGYRRMRVTGKVWLPTSNTGADQVMVTLSVGTTFVIAGRTAGWVDFRVEGVGVATSPTLQIEMNFAGGSGTQVAGDLLYLAEVKVQEVGAVLDLDCTVGAGTHLPDVGANGFNGTLSSANLDHLRPRPYGTQSVNLSLAHGDVSASAGVTKLLDLPPNAALLKVEIERAVALDSGITVAIGTSGDDDRYVAATAADTVGSAVANSLIQTVESATAFTSIYVRKSGSTTVGSLRFRVVYELRGNPSPLE